MGRAVILIDGEYLRKIFDSHGFRVNVPKVVDKVRDLTGYDEKSLLRTYLYTAPPYQQSVPSEEEKKRYKGFQRFMNFLRQQDDFEVRLGRTEKRGNDFEQKMVDVLFSIDLVELSAKSNIDTAILVAGDSDLVPAVEKAKNNGVKVILFCSFDRTQYHRELWNVADKRMAMDQDFMKECSQPNVQGDVT